MPDTPPALSAAADWLIGLAVPVAVACLAAAAAAAARARRAARDRAQRRAVREAVAAARADERARLAATLARISGPTVQPVEPAAVAAEAPPAPTPAPVNEPTPAPVGDPLAGLAACLVRPEPAHESFGDDPFRSVFNALPNPLWVFEEETLGFVAVNDAAVFKYGYTRDEVLKLSVRDVCPEEDVAALLDPSAESTADGRPTRWRHRTKAGVLLECDATAHRCRFLGRPARVVFAGDGSDRRRTAGWRSSSGRPRRWRRSAGSPAGWPTTSTTSSPSSTGTPTCCSGPAPGGPRRPGWWTTSGRPPTGRPGWSASCSRSAAGSRPGRRCGRPRTRSWPA
jgi:PAS domain-containing protein